MMRRAAPLLIGAIALVAAVLWATAGGAAIMPAYLAAWLVWAGLPIGALTLLLVFEIGAAGAMLGLVPALRALTLGMPFAALLFIPVLVWMPALYPWLAGHGPAAPFGQAWLHASGFIARAVIYLLILSALALLFAGDRPLGQRRAAALAGLFVLALVTTLAADDWFMSIDTGLHSGAFGLLILSLHCAVAVAGAILLGAAAGAVPVRAASGLLALISAVWLYLHFIQYLVIWSANLPAEAAWYLARDRGPGRGLAWVAGIDGGVLPVLLLLLPRWLRRIGLPPVAALVLLAHMAEALWFITPAAGRTTLAGPEVLFVLGFGSIALGLAVLRRLPPPPVILPAARREIA